MIPSRRSLCLAFFVVASCAMLALAEPVFGDGPGAIIGNLATLDHLKCYQVKDPLQPEFFQSDLNNQFGLEAGCRIAVPARFFCAETQKRILPPNQPPGGGPKPGVAGHFLCYRVRCPHDADIGPFGVKDQFGTRVIALQQERVLCAPADKLICGDGDVDPGEECDPGSPNANACPGGLACGADCACRERTCCQCSDRCVEATSAGECPSDCKPVAGVACSDRGACDECDCDEPFCTAPDGSVGLCKKTGTSIAAPCRCEIFDPPFGCCECNDATQCFLSQAACFTPVERMLDCEAFPPGFACGADNRCREVCPCDSKCTLPDGRDGKCIPQNGVCVCQEPPPPVCCVCAGIDQCFDDTTECPPGSLALCQLDKTCGPSGHCEDTCSCGELCLTASGNPGLCSEIGENRSCFCRPLQHCPCDTVCTLADGQVGECRPAGGSPDVCACQPPVEECGELASAICGGPCPTRSEECRRTANGVCRCQPRETCVEDANGVCGGFCPPDQLCVDTDAGCMCRPFRCGAVAPDPNGQCGGRCPDLHECRRVPGTDACRCVPVLGACDLQSDGTCGGLCSGALERCLPTSDGLCRCQPPPPPECGLDPNSHSCSGECPNPNQECRLAGDDNCRCLPRVHECGLDPVTNQCGGECKNPKRECRMSPSTSRCECLRV